VSDDGAHEVGTPQREVDRNGRRNADAAGDSRRNPKSVEQCSGVIGVHQDRVDRFAARPLVPPPVIRYDPPNLG
jgi:hypothetical protein